MTAPSEHIANQFVDLVQHFVHLRPKLAFPDERIANLKRQMRALRETRNAAPEDHRLLLGIPMLIAQRDVPPTMGELSAGLGIPLSSATRLADWLVDAKVVERCNDPNDRRVVRLCLTDHGRELIEAGREYMKARVQQLLRHFTAEEQAELLRLMSKLIDSIEAED